MCERCAEFDKKITHFKDLNSRVFDEQVREGIAMLIEQYEAQKIALHPEKKP